MKKKGGISLSASTVVIVILSLAVLIGLLFFVKDYFGETSGKVEQKIRESASEPNVEIESPVKGQIYLVNYNITFDGSRSYDDFNKIEHYYWDIDSDSKIDMQGVIAYGEFFEPGEYNVTLKVVNDAGKVGTTSVIVTVYSRNRKKESKYSDDTIFMIKDHDEDNWQSILRVLQLAKWNDRDGFHSSPYVVYYTPSGIDNNDVFDKMEDEETLNAVVFDDSDISSKSKTIGSDTYTIKTDSLDNYFDYWDFYETVTLVDSSNEGSALTAALFSSFMNAPLIFIDDDNFEDYKDKIEGSKLYIIDNLNLDSENWDFIHTHTVSQLYYSKKELRDPRVNRLIRLDSEINFD